MRTMLAVSVVGLGLGVTAAQCIPGGGSSATAKCEVMVLEDTIRAFASGNTVYATSKNDTVPRPRSICLALYASAGDTVPKPK